MGLRFGGFLGESPPKILRDKIAFAVQQLYTKIRFWRLCGLGEERTRFRKKKKRKKKSHRGQKWVVWDERIFQDIELCEIFFAVLKRFLNETAFYAKLAGRFLCSKTKVTGLIASKLGTSMQLINLKLLSKFHAATPSRS